MQARKQPFRGAKGVRLRRERNASAMRKQPFRFLKGLPSESGGSGGAAMEEASHGTAAAERHPQEAAEGTTATRGGDCKIFPLTANKNAFMCRRVAKNE